MDLELNFAAPSTSRSPSRSNVGGGHWKERMKNQQVARREQRKQDKPAAAAITGVAATPLPKQKVQKSSANGKTASPAAPGKSGKSKSSASGDREIRGQGGAAPPVNGDVDSDDERLRRSSAPNGAGPDAGPAQAAGKRQVISSLFSNLPKRPQSAATEATKDTEGAATADDLSVLTPSNAPSLGDDFDQLSVKKELVAHLKGKMGLAHPTTIQKLAVPFLCDPSSTSIRKDALLQAQTGSGKTLAYLLPIVQDLLRLSDAYKTKTGKSLDRSVGTLAIVLVPTRELAAQIFEVATKLLSFSGVGPQTPAGAEESGAPTTSFNNHRWITPGLLTGGAHRQHEKARLRKGVPLLIATVSTYAASACLTDVN
jgi:ATP-dependent RNA helicase DDX31/DBP7